jgi:hypothetical protein
MTYSDGHTPVITNSQVGFTASGDFYIINPDTKCMEIYTKDGNVTVKALPGNPGYGTTPAQQAGKPY